MLDELLHESAEPLALSIVEACKLSSLGRTTIYELIASKKLAARKCGRRTIVMRDELEQALKCLPRAGRSS